ncbi:NPCBM/NEW2 domain-containing protein, partial [Deinococcus pimensis]|uniref:NPCBM/NEW2 domain-containing protein n=1 Tax=Deinococcus pimensis TaxID=309888 RepID=UPI0004894AEB
MNFLVAALLSLTVPITSASPNPLPPLKPVLSSNGWGPAETNRSNGEQDDDDGGRLTVGGATFANGVGVHAPSRLTYRVPPGCSVLMTSVGVDDEVHEKGSVTFEVYGDDALLYRSPRLTGRDAAVKARVDVRGRRDLRLVVTDAGDGNDSDHADWGDVRLEGCAGSAGTRALGGPRPGVPVGAPLVITRGGRYTGVYESRNPDVAAVTIRTSEPVTLEDCSLRGNGHLITGTRVRLTVRRCHAQGLNPNV